MSAIIHSRVVHLDELIPRPVDIECEEKDVERLIPWVFRHRDTADQDCVIDWPDGDHRFSFLFDDLTSYYSELEDWRVNEGSGADGTGVSGALIANEIITLPRKSWEVSEKQNLGRFMRSQGMILQDLMRTVYWGLEGIKSRGIKIRFTSSRFRLKYVIGGKQYGTRPEGAVTVGPPAAECLPIISFTGWFEGQTRSEFLGETLSVMLGQLAKNVSVRSGGAGFGDQEVFVAGFHGSHFHIARVFFTADVISKVHSKGTSEAEVYELKFTRGYNLCLKEDWLEATRVLARLFRYLLSGNANIGAIQANLEKGADNAS